jgi:general secretion pathway protein J
MSAPSTSKSSPEAGFTLIEMLIATLLMTIILAALATVTAQWMPNWNRGMARVQRAERLALGLQSIVRDVSAAEMVSLNGSSTFPLFEGSELSVTFVRPALGPNSRPGLEVARLIEKADDQGPALVRERAPFVPMPNAANIAFSDPVVLLRTPLRVTFAYAGPDRVWQSTWHDEPLLPVIIRIAVRDAATGQLLDVSSAAMVHVNAPPECARAKGPASCLAEVAARKGAAANDASKNPL